MTNIAPDIIERLPCGAVIQHGSYNDRIYLMKPGSDENASEIPEKLIPMAERFGYTKIFAKIPETRFSRFKRANFIREGEIPDFYNGRFDALFMSYFLSDDRAEIPQERERKLDEIQKLALEKSSKPVKELDAAQFQIRRCEPGDADEMAEIYRAVFSSYPFPIHRPEYLKTTMESHVDYYGVEHEGALVALSSAELDRASQAAEMTDFATLPESRGNALSPSFIACHGAGDCRKGHKNRLYHCPRHIRGNEHHFCEGGIPVWRPAYQQHEYFRKHRKHEYLV